MDKESFKIEVNVPELLPTILDASVLLSRSRCETLIQAREKFHVSATLYNLLYEEYDMRKVFDTLCHFAQHRLKYLPHEKFDVQPLLEPYKFKKEYVEEIYPYYEKSSLPLEVKEIILDEYSFLKEHSSVLMATKRFAGHLYKWGIIILDASNQFYIWKHSKFEKIRGPKWILGVLLAITGMATEGDKLTGGGVIVALLDP